MPVTNKQQNRVGTSVYTVSRIWCMYLHNLMQTSVGLCQDLIVHDTSMYMLWTKGCLVRQESIVLANILWIHVNYCHKGAVACFYQEGGYNWNNVLSPNKWTCITGRAYKVFHLM